MKQKQTLRENQEDSERKDKKAVVSSLVVGLGLTIVLVGLSSITERENRDYKNPYQTRSQQEKSEQVRIGVLANPTSASCASLRQAIDYDMQMARDGAYSKTSSFGLEAQNLLRVYNDKNCYSNK